MTATTLTFASGATRELDYELSYEVLGLDAAGRVVVLVKYGETDPGYRFGLTLCCNAFDKGMEDGVYCRSCYGAKSDDTGDYGAVVVDPFKSVEYAA